MWARIVLDINETTTDEPGHGQRLVFRAVFGGQVRISMIGNMQLQSRENDNVRWQNEMLLTSGCC